MESTQRTDGPVKSGASLRPALLAHPTFPFLAF
jgi:hypothetical protein